MCFKTIDALGNKSRTSKTIDRTLQNGRIPDRVFFAMAFGDNFHFLVLPVASVAEISNAGNIAESDGENSKDKLIAIR